MYVPITTFNIGYPLERPWKRLPYYYSTALQKKQEVILGFSLFLGDKTPCGAVAAHPTRCRLSSRILSAIIAMNSEFVGFPRRLWMV